MTIYPYPNLHAPRLSEIGGLPITSTVYNSNQVEVEGEMAKNFAGLRYFVHGSPSEIGIGLNYFGDEPLSYAAIYSTV